MRHLLDIAFFKTRKWFKRGADGRNLLLRGIEFFMFEPLPL